MSRRLCVLGILWVLGPLGCGLSDDERCDKDQEYDSTGACVPLAAGEGGIGDTCESAADCGKDGADYCAKDPTDPQMTQGVCTFKDCTPSPESCPKGYKCCDFPEAFNATYPDVCLPEAAWEQTKAMCAG